MDGTFWWLWLLHFGFLGLHSSKQQILKIVLQQNMTVHKMSIITIKCGICTDALLCAFIPRFPWKRGSGLDLATDSYA